ncbi:hypothetical protein OHB35_00600 [Streptomyces phaeochromogenes]|uniref:Uncharacterized protein n=1 Tax=Streptomyces phaeochromogenes TaxID=1923 RepID=A0ABZ1GZX0_STRPH|nr:hypothetical protein [Streptomyces phaeochromogenes]WSD11834.1 hypothetical protein OHB35_00600 [Streptomyces phaeochromogenes]
MRETSPSSMLHPKPVSKRFPYLFEENRFLNKSILLELWSVLRKLISTAVKDVWEEVFPELRP